MNFEERRAVVDWIEGWERIQPHQVFEYRDADGIQRRLDTDAMRDWAGLHMMQEAVGIDLEKVSDMIRNGRINSGSLLKKAIEGSTRPIIVCTDFLDGEAEIVDGNHTYAALAITTMTAAGDEVAFCNPAAAPAFIFERELWRLFEERARPS